MKNQKKLRVALAQYNFTVGDLNGNRELVLRGINKAKTSGCDLVIFPELCLTGYPPEDLLLSRQFVKDQLTALQNIQEQVNETACILGFVDLKEGNIYNAAAVLYSGSLKGVYHKIQLPNYSVFDEERYFEAGNEPLVLTINGVRIGISICEDIWIKDSVPEAEVFCGGAEVLVNISASPYYIGKFQERFELIKTQAKRNRAFVMYNNLFGGQDELVFDGQSLIVNEHGELLASGWAFAEDFLICDIDVNEIRALRDSDNQFISDSKGFNNPFKSIKQVQIQHTLSAKTDPFPKPVKRPQFNEADEVYNALLLGLRDYVRKNGFQQVVFGLSGGIDSALVAAIASDALGSKNVHCITMPTRYSSSGSVDDSVLLANNLGIDLLKLPIENIFQSYLSLLEPVFKDLPFGLAEENLQARIRGTLVMALSNKYNWMALATGNKSEVSVGYCTIYGDMVGGFAPLKDVSKMWVYRLSRRRNERAGYDLIPQSIIDKIPSAELRPDQKDEDSLPPYHILDIILELYVEDNKSINEIKAEGIDRQMIKDVIRLVDNSEFKRRQAAPGIKITPRAFGKDRRMPVTNRYRMK
ncbi:NAD+ synthase [candidate division KSB1 bacterium]|nr:NAD+ synthase [candidate division KSB1 bacterium]